MLRHQLPKPASVTRVVVVGSAGFIGRAIVRRLQHGGVNVLALARSELDLLAARAADQLAAFLVPDDVLVMAAARAPCKTPAMMVENIVMAGKVCDALLLRPVAQVVYISSDAVYADTPVPITEASPAAPTTLHGAMHVAREQMFAAAAATVPYAILRPTLVYGAADPHDGYGPNRFRRQANRAQDIVLFGDGEERRDHIHAADVAELAFLVLAHRSEGVLNLATGTATSFHDAAEQVVALAPRKVAIRGSLRSGPMPHNGYRPFDVAATSAAFPDFRYTSLADGLARAQREEFA